MTNHIEYEENTPVWGRRLSIAMSFYYLWVLLALMFVFYVSRQQAPTGIYITLQIAGVVACLYYGFTALWVHKSAVNSEGENSEEILIPGFILPPMLTGILALIAVFLYFGHNIQLGVYIFIVQLTLGLVGTLVALFNWIRRLRSLQ